METQKEQERRYGTIEDFNRDNFDKKYVFVLNHQNPKPSIDGRYFPNSYSLKLEDSILCPITKKNRIIRVVDGETSIYKDEQSEDGQKREAKRVMFSPQGDFVIEGVEKLTLEWFLKSNKNGSNKDRRTNDTPRFYLLNLKKGLDEQMEKDKSEAEALNWCYQADFKQVRRYARVLGFDVERDPEEVRWSLRNVAKKEPKKFMDGLRNKYTTRKFYVLEAIDKSFVVMDTNANTLSWESGNIICHAPIGKNPVDHFVDLSLSTTDMDMTYRTIHNLVEPKENTEKEITGANKEPDTSLVNDNPEMDSIIKQALEVGVITQKKSWFYWGDRKYQGKRLSEALSINSTLMTELKREIADRVPV